MKRKLKLAACSLLTIATLYGSVSFANEISEQDISSRATSYSSYDLTIVSNGGYAYTSYNQTKSETGKQGNIRSTNVGGGYKVDARMQSSGSNGAWAYNVTDNDNRQLIATTSHTKGTSMRLNLKNKVATPVSVQAYGNWRSDDSN